MYNSCLNWTNGILSLIALVFAVLDLSYSKTIIIIATALILIHSIANCCGGCSGCNLKEKPPIKKKK